MCYNKIINHKSLYDFYIYYYIIHVVLLPFCMFGFLNLLSQIDLHYDAYNFKMTNIDNICNLNNTSLIHKSIFDINLATLVVFTLNVLYLIIEPITGLIFTVLSLVILFSSNLYLFIAFCDGDIMLKIAIYIYFPVAIILMLIFHYLTVIMSSKLNKCLHIILDIFLLPFFIIFKPISKLLENKQKSINDEYLHFNDL